MAVLAERARVGAFGRRAAVVDERERATRTLIGVGQAALETRLVAARPVRVCDEGVVRADRELGGRVDVPERVNGPRHQTLKAGLYSASVSPATQQYAPRSGLPHTQGQVERVTFGERPGEVGAYVRRGRGIERGLGIPPHVHEHEDEVIFVVEGTYDLWIAGQTHKASAGSVFHFPRGIPHGFTNAGSTPGRTFWNEVPGRNFETFFDELGALPPGPPDMAKVAAIFGKYNIDILPPPAGG